MANNFFIFDPNIWDLRLAGTDNGTRYTVEKWSERLNADLIFNLTTFATRGVTVGRPDTEVFINNVRLCWGKEDVSDFVQVNPTDKARGYSNAIKDGVVKLSHKFGGSSYRNGIGITNRGHIIVAQTSHKTTELAFATEVNNFIKNRGQAVKLFVLEDGGGSTQEYSTRSKLYWTATPEKRPVPTVIYAKYKGTPTISSPVYNGSRGADTVLIQTLLGGIAADGDGGPATANRIKAAQTALAFPTSLRCGICSAYTAKALGVKYLT